MYQAFDRDLIIALGLPARSDVKPPHGKAVLNANRPSNPFTPTDEPDWVVIDKNPSREPPKASPTSHRTKSANEIVHKSPVLFESGQPIPTKDTRNLTGPQELTNESRSGASSQASTVPASSRKPVPPVPKKPLLLSETSGRRASQNSSNSATDRTAPATRSTVLQRAPSNDPRARVRPPPQRTTQIPLRPSPQSQQVSAAADGPPLPPRRMNTAAQSADGLMDDDIVGGASSIPSLQPTRRS